MKSQYLLFLFCIKSMYCDETNNKSQTIENGSHKTLQIMRTSKENETLLPTCEAKESEDLLASSSYINKEELPYSSIVQTPDTYFPTIEYPTSVIEAARPFYYNSGLDDALGPFTDDIRSNYKSISTGANMVKSKIKPKNTLKNVGTIRPITRITNMRFASDKAPARVIKKSTDFNNASENLSNITIGKELLDDTTLNEFAENDKDVSVENWQDSLLGEEFNNTDFKNSFDTLEVSEELSGFNKIFSEEQQNDWPEVFYSSSMLLSNYETKDFLSNTSNFESIPEYLLGKNSKETPLMHFNNQDQFIKSDGLEQSEILENSTLLPKNATINEIENILVRSPSLETINDFDGDSLRDSLLTNTDTLAR